MTLKLYIDLWLFFLETENSINSYDLIPLIRQVLDFAPVKVSLKLHFSCVHLMKGNQKIANFYEKKVNPFSKVFNRKVLFCHISVAFFFSFFITVAGLTDTCQLKYLNFNGNTLFCFHDTARPITCFLVNLIAQHRSTLRFFFKFVSGANSIVFTIWLGPSLVFLSI